MDTSTSSSSPKVSVTWTCAQGTGEVFKVLLSNVYSKMIHDMCAYTHLSSIIYVYMLFSIWIYITCASNFMNHGQHIRIRHLPSYFPFIWVIWEFPQVYLPPQQRGLHAAPKRIVSQTGATTRLEANTKKGCGNQIVWKWCCSGGRRHAIWLMLAFK